MRQRPFISQSLAALTGLAMLAAASAALAQTAINAQDRVDIRLLDEDGDGSLSRAEVAANTRLSERFVEIDTNLDRSISRDEADAFNRTLAGGAAIGNAGATGNAGTTRTPEGARTNRNSAGQTGGLGQTSSGRSDEPDIGSRFGSGVEESEPAGAGATGGGTTR